jgi:hypothetical protein
MISTGEIGHLMCDIQPGLAELYLISCYIFRVGSGQVFLHVWLVSIELNILKKHIKKTGVRDAKINRIEVCVLKKTSRSEWAKQ